MARQDDFVSGLRAADEFGELRLGFGYRDMHIEFGLSVADDIYTIYWSKSRNASWPGAIHHSEKFPPVRIARQSRGYGNDAWQQRA
jgi:hypothetical protein